MMIQDIEKTIREYIPSTLHMSLATSVDNRPRVCEVHFVYDQDLNFYFRSKPSRRHSQEIATNPYVSANIVEQHAREDKPRAVYLEWSVEMIHWDDIKKIVNLFQKRFDLDASDIVEESSKENGHKFYKISVSNFALFDKRESNPSQKYELKRK